MAQKTLITLLDDMNGRDITDKGETIRFALDGVDYEIDLGDKNAVRLRKAFEPFVAKARRTGGTKKATRGRKLNSNEAMRKWGRDNGFVVADRGRVPTKLQQAYKAAHPPALRAVV